MNTDAIKPNNLPTKIIYCQRSGLPLASVTALCSQGWPFLNNVTGTMLHPIYNMELTALIVRLRDKASVAHDAAWFVESHIMDDIRVCMSAIMYSLDAMWLPPAADSFHKIEPSLPATSVAVGSAKRLLDLASWYHYATSKRLSFPLYRATSKNKNLDWSNFKDWLDTAWDIRKEWEEGRSEAERQELLRKRNEALLTVKAEDVYKRVDFNKVWNWIDVQLAANKEYPVGRRETFKSIFMKADTNPEDWTVDDVEDLQFAITECCDIGNEITYFINRRLNNIKAGISAFYSSFTLITHVASDNANPEMSEHEQAKTQQFFSEFDRRVESLESLPPAPKREQFASMAHFLKAQAQHNILARRFEMAKTRTAASTVPTNPANPANTNL